MTQLTRMSFVISNTDPAVPLGTEVWVDDQRVLNVEHVCEPVEFAHEFDDDQAGEHCIRVVMKYKTRRVTKVDSQGKIVKDALLTLSKFFCDHIDIESVFIELSTYTHTNNGATEPIQQRFYGAMGCNGTVELKFSTPIYLWLLENMNA